MWKTIVYITYYTETWYAEVSLDSDRVLVCEYTRINIMYYITVSYSPTKQSKAVLPNMQGMVTLVAKNVVPQAATQNRRALHHA